MFLDDLSDLLRVLVVGVLGYAVLVLTLRISGKRTLSKMNAFDLVITVSLGSTLATMLLSSEVSLAEGVLALVLLVSLQYVVAWLTVRSALFAGAVRAEPALLLYHGQLLQSAMRQERVSEADIEAALRAAGHASLQAVRGVVLETDGSFSVVTAAEQPGDSLLENVRKREPVDPQAA